METKKNPHADVHAKARYFFLLGLSISTGLAITAFEWRTQVSRNELLAGRNADVTDPLIIIPTTVIPPVQPKPQAQIIVEVKNDGPETKDIPIIDISLDPEPNPDPIKLDPEPEVDTEIIYVAPEEAATPVGGFTSFYQYVAKETRYPSPARRMNIEGKVFVEFLVNKDGSISDIHTVKGIGAGCDEEAERIIEHAPKWNAAKQRGKPVRQRFTLVIAFKLN